MKNYSRSQIESHISRYVKFVHSSMHNIPIIEDYFRLLAQEDMCESALVYAQHCPRLVKQTFNVPDIWAAKIEINRMRWHLDDCINDNDDMDMQEKSVARRDLEGVIKRIKDYKDPFFAPVVLKPIGITAARPGWNDDRLYLNGYIAVKRRNKIHIIDDIEVYHATLKLANAPFTGYTVGAASEGRSFSARNQDIVKLLQVVYEQTT